MKSLINLINNCQIFRGSENYNQNNINIFNKYINFLKDRLMYGKHVHNHIWR